MCAVYIITCYNRRPGEITLPHCIKRHNNSYNINATTNVLRPLFLGGGHYFSRKYCFIELATVAASLVWRRISAEDKCLPPPPMTTEYGRGPFRVSDNYTRNICLHSICIHYACYGWTATTGAISEPRSAGKRGLSEIRNFGFSKTWDVFANRFFR